MSNPKVQFQVDHGSGWKTVAEVDIIDGVAQAPNAWMMVRALRKQIVYTGWVEEVTTVPPVPRDAHFAGYAKVLLAELLDKELVLLLLSDIRKREAQTLEELNEVVSDSREWKRQAETILARRAYDLVYHAFDGISEGTQVFSEVFTPEENIANVPDLTELPKEEE